MRVELSFQQSNNNSDNQNISKRFISINVRDSTDDYKSKD